MVFFGSLGLGSMLFLLCLIGTEVGLMNNLNGKALRRVTLSVLVIGNIAATCTVSPTNLSNSPAYIMDS